MAGRGECKWPVCKRRAFYNARRLRCDFFSLLRRIVHSKIKVKSARRRDDFSHPRVHFTAPRSRGLLSDLLELVYTGSKTYLAFSCETLTTLRHSNHAPRIIPLLSSRSLSLSVERGDSERQLISRRKGAGFDRHAKRGIARPAESRSTRRLSIATIMSIKPPGLAIPRSPNDFVPRGKDTRFTHPFTLFSL